MNLFEQWVWPKVGTRRNAQNAIEEGFWAAAFVSGMSGLFGLTGLLGAPSEFTAREFLVAAVFAGVAFGIRRRFRLAALAALMLYVAERVYASLAGGPATPFLPLLIILAFINGIRGTFAYHRFPPLPANLPSIEQSFQAVGKASPQEGQGTNSRE